jgi:hypothetical protein
MNFTKQMMICLSLAVFLTLSHLLWTRNYAQNRYHNHNNNEFRNNYSSSRLHLEEQIKKVLKSEIAFAAKDFSDNSYNNSLLFPNVGIMRGGTISECPNLSPNLVVKKQNTSTTSRTAEWDFLVGNIRKNGRQGRAYEFLQEVGFIEMLRAYYPKSFTIVSNLDTASSLDLEVDKNFTSRRGAPAVLLLEDLIKISPVPRVFLPFCGMFAGHGPFGKMPLVYADGEISRLQKQLSPKKIFYVSPHPGTVADGWEGLINNARALKIDQCSLGFFDDIIIPISTAPSICDYSSNEQQIRKQNLIYSAGADHSVKYAGLRSEIPKTFNSLVNRTGIDMSPVRGREEYELGFYKSKFCLIVPGDTTGTSQVSRAMCAGCVPIFLALDFRDLPFSNILDYSSFSIRIHSNHLVTNNTLLDNERASNLYNMLDEMVVNGTYDKLRRNVEIARDFCNYHNFGSRSPYGAAFVSMYQDEINELKRR